MYPGTGIFSDELSEEGRMLLGGLRRTLGYVSILSFSRLILGSTTPFLTKYSSNLVSRRRRRRLRLRLVVQAGANSWILL